MLQGRIHQILTPGAISVPPGASVSEAIDKMRANNISCILIVEDGRPLGIFTERNIVRYVARGAEHFTDRYIRDFMTSPVLTTTGDAYIYEAFNLLTTRTIRHLAVVDDRGQAVGVLTQSDLVQHLAYDDFLEIKKVSQIMTKSVCTVSQDETVRHALMYMAERPFSCIIVAEDNRPLGILTERDVARLVTEQRDIGSLKVCEVMSSPPQTVPRDTPAYQAVCYMLQKDVRRLIVVDDDGKIEGLTTQSDIVKGLEGRYIEILKQVIKEKDAALQDTLKDLHTKTVYLDNILRSSIDMGIVATDVNYRIVYYNPAAEHIMGYPSKDVVGVDAREIHMGKDVEPSRFTRVMDKLQEGLRHAFTFEQRKNRANQFIQARVSGIRDREGNPVGFVLMLQDITERKKAEETIRHMAYHDALTGLPNRELFNERLSLELAHAERGKSRLALMVMDVDRFKEVNDTLGHMAGDVLLKSVAARVKELLRKSDTVARMGGDEFMLIVPKIPDVQNALAVADKILQTIAQPFDIDGHQQNITVSIGISLHPMHGSDPDVLLKLADNAMYRAKEQNRVNFKSNVYVYPLD